LLHTIHFMKKEKYNDDTAHTAHGLEQLEHLWQ